MLTKSVQAAKYQYKGDLAEGILDVGLKATKIAQQRSLASQTKRPTKLDYQDSYINYMQSKYKASGKATGFTKFLRKGWEDYKNVEGFNEQTGTELSPLDVKRLSDNAIKNYHNWDDRKLNLENFERVAGDSDFVSISDNEVRIDTTKKEELNKQLFGDSGKTVDTEGYKERLKAIQYDKIKSAFTSSLELGEVSRASVDSAVKSAHKRGLINQQQMADIRKELNDSYNNREKTNRDVREAQQRNNTDNSETVLGQYGVRGEETIAQRQANRIEVATRRSIGNGNTLATKAISDMRASLGSITNRKVRLRKELELTELNDNISSSVFGTDPKNIIQLPYGGTKKGANQPKDIFSTRVRDHMFKIMAKRYGRIGWATMSSEARFALVETHVNPHLHYIQTSNIPEYLYNNREKIKNAGLSSYQVAYGLLAKNPKAFQRMQERIMRAKGRVGFGNFSNDIEIRGAGNDKGVLDMTKDTLKALPDKLNKAKERLKNFFK